GDGIAEEHDSQTRNDQIGADIVKGKSGCVAEEGGRAGELAQAFGGPPEHGFGDIDADDAPGWTHGASELKGGAAAATADIDHRRADGWRGKSNQRPNDRSEHAVEAILLTGPVFAIGSIPAGALIGVEGLGRGHGWIS